MNPDPLFGVFLHWLGGLSSASFYVPYKRIRGWSWEIFWLTGGIFSWLIAPWLFAAIQTGDAVRAFHIDPRTGALAATHAVLTVVMPTCLRIVGS